MGPDHWYWEAESCGAANLSRSSDVFEETEVLHNRSCHPFKAGEKKVDCEDGSVADVSLPQLSHLSTGDGQHFTVRDDGCAAMKVHQVLQKAVMPLLPHYDVTAVLHRIDHEMSAAVLSSDGGGDLMSGTTGKRTPFPSHVPIRERVTGPALADSDEEVALRLGHQQFFCCPTNIYTQLLEINCRLCTCEESGATDADR